MRFIIKLAIEGENGTETIEEIMRFNKGFDDKNIIGLSLLEAKQVLKNLQSKVVSSQAIKYIESKRKCAFCCKN